MPSYRTTFSLGRVVSLPKFVGRVELGPLDIGLRRVRSTNLDPRISVRHYVTACVVIKNVAT